MYEVDAAANEIRAEVDANANIIMGSTFDEALEGRIRVSVVATGIDDEATSRQQTVVEPARRAAEDACCAVRVAARPRAALVPRDSACRAQRARAVSTSRVQALRSMQSPSAAKAQAAASICLAG